MTFPIDFHLFGITINSHLVFEILSYSIGFRYYLWLRKHTHDPISDSNRLWIFIGAAAGGLAGSRILGVLEDPRILFDAHYVASQPLSNSLAGWLICKVKLSWVGCWAG